MPGEAFGVGLTPMSSLCERCALSLEVDRSEEHGRLRRIAVAGVCVLEVGRAPRYVVRCDLRDAC